MLDELSMPITYTSPPLCEYMLTRETYYCRTLRANRKYIPKDIVNKKLKRSDMVSKQNEKGVKNFNWKDKEMLHYQLFLSTQIP